MSNLVSVQRVITPDDDPIVGETLVGAARRVSVPVRTKPGIIDLGSEESSLAEWVDEVGEVEDLLLFVGTEEKDVDEISLREFRETRVPCREVNMSNNERVGIGHTNEGGVLMLEDTSVGGGETGEDVVARVDLAVCHGLADLALVSYHLPSLYCPSTF